jgi:hypothetical protein
MTIKKIMFLVNGVFVLHALPDNYSPFSLYFVGAGHDPLDDHPKEP